MHEWDCIINDDLNKLISINLYQQDAYFVVIYHLRTLELNVLDLE